MRDIRDKFRDQMDFEIFKFVHSPPIKLTLTRTEAFYVCGLLQMAERYLGNSALVKEQVETCNAVAGRISEKYDA